ncbi:MAG: o-succinylbenzoate synthase [Cyclobacteriaceae bacterium]|nr:o-succinylbenzoate synthase [Cyclobacteriaceae bacterium]
MPQIDIVPYNLKFSFEAKTSRGSLLKKQVWFIKVYNDKYNKIGWGECNVIPGLSADGDLGYESILNNWKSKFIDFEPNSEHEILEFVSETIPNQFPAMKMAFETAFLDYLSVTPFEVFGGDFFAGIEEIPINGLIWMGNSEFMKKQLQEKIKMGFTCIKIKIGGIDFEEECKILSYVVNEYKNEGITLRLDANGAFSQDNALKKLEKLAKFNIHSIEQPLPSGSLYLFDLLRLSPIPIALDEELIGKYGKREMEDIVSMKPNFLILKPSLLGGFRQTSEWIDIAEKENIGWWITSALESNIGLNAIAQFTAGFNNPIPQGLGTGLIYDNNVTSPLTIRGESLIYDKNKQWDISLIDNSI